MLDGLMVMAFVVHPPKCRAALAVIRRASSAFDLRKNASQSFCCSCGRGGFSVSASFSDHSSARRRRISISACASRPHFSNAFSRRGVHTANGAPQEYFSTELAWKSWQFGGLSIDTIAEKYRTTREAVLQHLVTAVETGKPIDWTALCKEVGLGCGAATEIYKSLPRAPQGEWPKSKMEAAAMKKLAASRSEITKEQVQLCILMLGRGFSIEDIRAVISVEDGYFADEKERLRLLSNELQKSRKVKKEFFRVSQGKVVVLDQGLMDLLRDRNGASLLEIAAFFSDCDQKQLVNLLYELEKAGNICFSEGKYKVVDISIY